MHDQRHQLILRPGNVEDGSGPNTDASREHLESRAVGDRRSDVVWKFKRFWKFAELILEQLAAAVQVGWRVLTVRRERAVEQIVRLWEQREQRLPGVRGFRLFRVWEYPGTAERRLADAKQQHPNAVARVAADRELATQLRRSEPVHHRNRAAVGEAVRAAGTDPEVLAAKSVGLRVQRFWTVRQRVRKRIAVRGTEQHVKLAVAGSIDSNQIPVQLY